MVSVVLATNRGGPFLREAIASVMEQSYRNLELIVVDDGSTNPTEISNVVAEFCEVRLIRTDPSGVSAARNRGVQEAVGELLAFIDDDDRWDRDRLLKQVQVMAASPSAVASYCRMRTIDAQGQQLVAGDQLPPNGVRDVITGRAGVLLPNLMVRRSAFDRVGGFNPAYRQAEDLDLVLSLTEVDEFEFVEDVLVDYRHHGSNTTRSYRDLASSIRSIVAKHRELAIAADQPDRARDLRIRQQANDRFAVWSAARSARRALRERRAGAAISDIAWAVRFAPTAPWSWIRRRLVVNRVADRLTNRAQDHASSPNTGPV